MITKTALKTPLRYPGGKSRAVKKMVQFLPDLQDYSEYREPFLGGGSFALYITQTYPHMDVWVNDLYEPLYTFWKTLQRCGDKLTEELTKLKSKYPDRESARGLFLDAKDYLEKSPNHCKPFERAVYFYVVNKCSFSGLSESSSFSPQASESNFSLRGIEKLQHYQKIISKWHITNLSYERLLTDDENVFVYLDPPYEIRSTLYGRKGGMHKGFSHDQFANWCDGYECHQMISYNSSNLIKKRFLNWHPYEYDHTYTMRSVGHYMSDQQQRKELILTNYVKQLPS